MIPSTPTCVSCRLAWKADAVKVLGPDGRVYHDACARYLGYLPGQQLDILAPYPTTTVNGQIHALGIMFGIYRVPDIQNYGDRLDAVETAAGRERSEGTAGERVKALQAEYGDRLNLPRVFWRLAAQLD